MRALNHRILTKLTNFEETLPLLKNNPKTMMWLNRIITENSNNITEYCNKPQNKINPDSTLFLENKLKIVSPMVSDYY